MPQIASGGLWRALEPLRFPEWVFEAVDRPRGGERGSDGVDEAWRAVGRAENEAGSAAKCQKRVAQALLAARNRRPRPRIWIKLGSQAGGNEPRE